MSPGVKRHLRAEDYGVAIICPLEKEMSATRFMLEEEHEKLDTQPGDPNGYLFGTLSGHNVILCWLPQGFQGTGPAAEVSTHLQRSFPNARLRLLVGIGGGVPSVSEEIRLGDVVIAMPEGTVGGVVQYDFGKATIDDFKRAGTLRAPPVDWRNAIVEMMSDHRVKNNRISEYHSEMLSRYPRLASTYGYPGGHNDILFHNDCNHIAGNKHCRDCDSNRFVKRSMRASKSPQLFYGIIASGNSLIKNPDIRDEVAADCGGALCFEMEAAGLATNFDCIVIRGICDYADSHKNDIWQEYAAASAAGAAKELLGYLKPRKQTIVHIHDAQHPVADASHTQDDSSALPLRNNAGNRNRLKPVSTDDFNVTGKGYLEYAKGFIAESYQRLLRLAETQNPKAKYLSSFYRIDYEADLQVKLKKICPETCAWILQHRQFEKWFPLETLDFLWLVGGPGVGKTLLAANIIRDIKKQLLKRKQSASKTVLYTFYDEDQVSSPSDMLALAMFQLFEQYPAALESASRIDASYLTITKGGQPPRRFQDLWNLMQAIIEDIGLTRVYLICDGLEHLEAKPRADMMLQLCQCSSLMSVLVLSQPCEKTRIKLGRLNNATISNTGSILSLDGEESSLNADIELFIIRKTAKIAKDRDWTDQELTMVRKSLSKKRAGVFVPFRIALKKLKETETATLESTLKDVFDNMDDLNHLYEALITALPSEFRSKPSKLLSSALYAVRALRDTEAAFLCGYIGDGACKDHEIELKRLRSDVRRYGYLLRYRTTNNTITFLHESAHSHLYRLAQQPDYTRIQLLSSSDGHYELAIQCLNVLISCSNIKVPKVFADSFWTKLQEVYAKHVFLAYAVENWSVHVQKALRTIAVSTDKKHELERLLTTLVKIIEDEEREDFVLLCVSTRILTKSPFRDETKVTLLNIYCWLGLTSMLEDLLTSNVAKSDIISALHVAAFSGHVNVFQTLRNLCEAQDISAHDWSKMIACASEQGSVAVFRQLMSEKKFDVADIAGATFSGFLGSHYQILEIIREYRTSIIAMKRNELNIMQWIAATRFYHDPAVFQKVLEFFTDMGVGLRATDRMGNTILHLICHHSDMCDPDLIAFLIHKGIDPQKTNRCGWLPLHLASRRGGSKALETLISRMDHQSITNGSNQGSTALHWAMERYMDEQNRDEDLLVLELLLARGLSLMTTTRSGSTPLELALHNPFMFGILSVVLYRLDGVSNVSSSLLDLFTILNSFRSIEELWQEANRFGFLIGNAKSQGRLIKNWAISDDQKLFHLWCVMPRIVLVIVKNRILSWVEPDANSTYKEQNNRLLLLSALIDFLLDLGGFYLHRKRRETLKAATFHIMQTLQVQTKDGHTFITNAEPTLSQLQVLMGQHLELQRPKQLSDLLHEQLHIVHNYPLSQVLPRSHQYPEIEEDETEQVDAAEVFYIRRKLSRLYLRNHRWDESERLTTESLNYFRASNALCVGDIQIWHILSDLALTKMRRKNSENYEAAIELFEEALMILEQQKPLESIHALEQIDYKSYLAQLYALTGQSDEWLATQSEVVDLMRGQKIFDRNQFANALEDLSDSYHKHEMYQASLMSILDACAVLSGDSDISLAEVEYIRTLADKLYERSNKLMELEADTSSKAKEHRIEDISEDKIDLILDPEQPSGIESRLKTSMLPGLIAALLISGVWIWRRNP